MTRSKKDKNGVCAFCGANGEMTKDHVPPKNLFKGFSDDKLIKVPSCNKCNSETKKDDEYFRAFLIPQQHIASHPQAQKLNEHVRKKFDENERKDFEKRMYSQLHNKDIYTPAGIYLGKGNLIYPEYSRIDRVLKKILRGLYYYLIQRPFPLAFLNLAIVEETQVHELQKILNLDLDYWIDELSRFPINNIHNVFSFRCAASKESPISAWCLTFFENRHFFALTYPKALGPEVRLVDADPSEIVTIQI